MNRRPLTVEYTLKQHAKMMSDSGRRGCPFVRGVVS
jgi:hypothetical protein